MRVMRFAMLGGLALVAACVPRSEPPPAPDEPRGTRRPLPPPPAPTPEDWRDIALSPGGWVYSSQPETTQALFGPAASEASFVVRCDRARRTITLSREGNATAPTMTIRTSFTARNLPAEIQREPLPYTSATVSAGDPILDSMVFSRGRFTVEVPGTPMLVIPSWPEPARVIEDCRD